MRNVTYLLGAGASCKALPIVKDIPERLNKFKIQLETIAQTFGIDSSLLAAAIGRLSKETAKHASVDTFAKKLFLQDNFKDLNKLKVILSMFLQYEQME